MVSPLPIVGNPSIPAKFYLNQKTGYFFADAFLAHLIMFGAVLIFVSIRSLKDKLAFLGAIYRKINPYLLTYLFRLVFLELSLSMMLYLTNFEVQTPSGIISLVLLVIDLIAILASLAWKIKTR